MRCPDCGTPDGCVHLAGCTFVAEREALHTPQSVDELIDRVAKRVDVYTAGRIREYIFMQKERVQTLEHEREKLLAAWGKLKDDTLKIVAIMDSMKIEFSKIAISRDEWRQLAARYRTMVNTHHPLQGDQNATDEGPVSSPP